MNNKVYNLISTLWVQLFQHFFAPFSSPEHSMFNESFCGRWVSLTNCNSLVSVVGCQSTICSQQHLLLNHFIEFNQTSQVAPFQSCSKIIILYTILFAMATERKISKIFLSKTTDPFKHNLVQMGDPLSCPLEQSDQSVFASMVIFV